MKATKVLVSLKNIIYGVKDGRLKGYRAVYGDYAELEPEDHLEIREAETNEELIKVQTSYAILEDFHFLKIGSKNPIKISKDSISAMVPYEGEIPAKWDVENWDMTEHKFLEAESSILVVE